MDTDHHADQHRPPSIPPRMACLRLVVELDGGRVVVRIIPATSAYLPLGLREAGRIPPVTTRIIPAEPTAPTISPRCRTNVCLARMRPEKADGHPGHRAACQVPGASSALRGWARIISHWRLGPAPPASTSGAFNRVPLAVPRSGERLLQLSSSSGPAPGLTTTVTPPSAVSMAGRARRLVAGAARLGPGNSRRCWTKSRRLPLEGTPSGSGPQRGRRRDDARTTPINYSLFGSDDPAPRGVDYEPAQGSSLPSATTATISRWPVGEETGDCYDPLTLVRHGGDAAIDPHHHPGPRPARQARGARPINVSRSARVNPAAPKVPRAMGDHGSDDLPFSSR